MKGKIRTTRRNRTLDAELRRLTRTTGAEVSGPAARMPVFAGGGIAEPEMPRSRLRVLVLLNPTEMPISNQSGSRGRPDWLGEDWHWERVTSDIAIIELSSLDLRTLEGKVAYAEAPKRLFSLSEDYEMVSRIVPAADLTQQHQGPTGKGIVVGIIDLNGLDWTMADFVDPKTGLSRVEYLWDQSLAAQPGEHSPREFGYGVEYQSKELSQAFGSGLEKIRHVYKARSHGTHVTGIAAGNGSSNGGNQIGMAPEATIIYVDPTKSEERSDGLPFMESPDVVSALDYIFTRAGVRPCVVNMSVGSTFGSHDGESLFERAIDQHLTVPGRAVVVAAGNQAQHETHSCGFCQHNGEVALKFHVPSSVSSPVLELWYSSADAFEVSLQPPGSTWQTDWVGPDEDYYDQTPYFDAVDIANERFHPLNGDGRILVTIGDRPLRNGTGEWTLHIKGKTVSNGRFNAWLELHPNPNHQTTFLTPSSSHTICLPATAHRVIAVANCDDGGLPPAIDSTSSLGPTRDERQKPDLAAHGVNVLSANANGGPTNPRTVMTGTSMSAPKVSGAVAQLLQVDGSLTAPQIAGILRASARTQQNADRLAWGAGQLDVSVALNFVRLRR